MMNINKSWFKFSCAVCLAIGTFSPLPARATRVYNVQTYHATGNGVSDDTFYILQAAKAAAMDPGSILLFPKGNYIFSGELLNLNNSIEMVGENATLIMLNGPVRLNGSNVSVHSMNFTSRNPSGGTAIVVINVNGFEIRNCTFASGFANDISVTQSYNGKISANQMAMGTSSSSAINLAQISGNITVQDNAITGNGGGSGTALQASDCNNLSFASNTVSNVPFGIGSQNSTSVSYTSNSLESCGQQAITFNGGRKITLSKNKILSTGGTAIQLTGLDSAEIQNNTITSCKYGINAQGVSGNPITVNITGNTISSVDKDAVSASNAGIFAVIGNTITKVGVAVNTTNVSAFLSIQENNIANCLKGAIIANNCKGVNRIQDNTIMECGTFPSVPAAVIYFNAPGAADIVITSNTYSSPLTQIFIKYFIWCVQPQPPAEIFGNRTNTGLPNRIGS